MAFKPNNLRKFTACICGNYMKIPLTKQIKTQERERMKFQEGEACEKNSQGNSQDDGRLYPSLQNTQA